MQRKHAKLLIFLISVFFFNLQLFATPQAPDILIYKGDTTSLFAYPLEKYEKYDSLRLKLFGKQNGCGSWERIYLSDLQQRFV